MKRLLPTLAAAALALASGATASALTVAPAPLDQLWVEADAVVRGTVVEATSLLTPGSPRVSTRLSLIVWRQLKPASGAPIGPTLSLTLPGGQRGRLRTVVPGVPRLSPGDEVLLLLERHRGAWVPLGYSLGTLFIDARGRLHACGPQGRPSAAPLPGAGWLSEDAIPSAQPGTLPAMIPAVRQ